MNPSPTSDPGNRSVWLRALVATETRVMGRTLDDGWRLQHSRPRHGTTVLWKKSSTN